jgi:hypothetical protein
MIKMKKQILFLFLLFFLGKANAQLTSGEYFFDTAPAVGGGTAFSFTSANNINQTLNMPIASLASGFHNVFIRVKDGANTWSHYEGRTFYIIPTVIFNPQPQLTAGEWFLDTDPGVGNGTAITFAQGNTVNSTIALNDAALVAGFHNLFIRVKDASNVWSHYEGRTFYVIPTTTNTIQPNLVAGEWFIDTDPGLGNGTAINFTASDAVNPIIAIPSGNLSVGIHHLFIRVRDANGVWSHYEGRQFANDPLGIELNDLNKITLYPNPTHSILNIQTDQLINTVTITDMSGRTTAVKTLSSNSVDVSHLSQGVYLIEFKTETGFFRKKFIKN